MARQQLYYQQLNDELKQCHAENEQLQSELKLHQANHKEMMTSFGKVEQELAQHKDQLANMEQLFKAQQQQHKSQLEQANQLQRSQLEEVRQQQRQAYKQLDDAITNNDKLNDDVLAKTQQVKQYKKQVDGLKTELAKYRSQMGTKSHQLQDKEEVGCTGQGHSEACVFP